MEGSAERELWERHQAARPVRVGDTIRRPAHHRSAYVDEVLRHLAGEDHREPAEADRRDRNDLCRRPGVEPCGNRRFDMCRAGEADVDGHE